MRELQNITADRELSRAITALHLEVDESIVNNLRGKVDAALRRAKAEGVRDIAQHAFMKAELWDMAGKMEQANAIRALAIEIDARAAQIEASDE